MNISAYCTNCGSGLESGDRFCATCGTPIRSDGYVSPRSRALWTTIFFGLFAAMAFFSILAADAQIDLFERIGRGEPIPNEELESREGLRNLASGLRYVALLGSIITFSTWLYTVRRNFQVIGIEELRFTPVWSVIWFFIPVANFFVPYKVMDETWKASDPTVSFDEPDTWMQTRSSLLVGAWWVVWFVAGLLGQGFELFSDPGETPSEMISANQVEMAFNAVMVAASIFGSVVVNTITSRQGERYLAFIQHSTPSV